MRGAGKEGVGGERVDEAVTHQGREAAAAYGQLDDRGPAMDLGGRGTAGEEVGVEAGDVAALDLVAGVVAGAADLLAAVEAVGNVDVPHFVHGHQAARVDLAVHLPGR